MRSNCYSTEQATLKLKHYPLATTLAYSLTLTLIYITIFPEGMARHAHSYWRFMGHVQFFLVAGLCSYLLVRVNALTANQRGNLQPLAITIVILGQLWTAHILQPELKPTLREADRIANAWGTQVLPERTCLPNLFDDEQMEMMRYDLRGKTIVVRCHT